MKNKRELGYVYITIYIYIYIYIYKVLQLSFMMFHISISLHDIFIIILTIYVSSNVYGQTIVYSLIFYLIDLF